MTKQELSQLRKLGREIDQDSERLESLKSQWAEAKIPTVDSVQGSSPVFPYLKHTSIIKGLAASDVKISTMYSAEVKRIKLRVKRNLKRCINERVRLEEYVDSISDSEMRQIIQLYYIDCLSWPQVAEQMKTQGDGSTQRKKLETFLKSFPCFPDNHVLY